MPSCHRTKRLGSRRAMRPSQCMDARFRRLNRPNGFASDTGPSHRWLAAVLGRTVGSLRSIRVTGLHHHYEPVRPCAPHRYSAPRGSAAWRSPLASEQQVPTFRRGASRWTHATFMPVAARPSQQAPSELCPRPTTGAWFRQHPYAFDMSSAVHSRSSFQRTPDGSCPPFPQRSPPRPLSRSSLRWFEPWSCNPSPRGQPSCQAAACKSDPSWQCFLSR